MKKVSQLIYGIKGLSIDTLIDTYIERLSHIEVVDDTHHNENGTWEPEIKIIEPKHKPSRNVLYPKFQFLIHLIITRCMRSKDNIAYLHNDTYSNILGDQLSQMLRTLEQMEIISIGYYIVGVNSQPISLNVWNIYEYKTFNKKIIEMDDKIKNINFIPKNKNNDNSKQDAFISEYNSNLSLLHLTHNDDAIAYINTHIDKNTHSYYYYLHCINESIKHEHSITSTDLNGRIYHHLTNLPRSLKQFYNIKYQLDIHNSHPLLFNYYLIKEFNIPINIINNINKTLVSPLYIHNDPQYFRNLLNDISLQNNVATIPNDALLYMLLTSKGVFWDAFTIKGKSRDEVKKKMFAEVFYSDSTDTIHDEYIDTFRKTFPSVYELINRMKADETKLPNRMMRIESALMRKILTRFYEQGFKVVSIHDAVIVLDVDENKTFRCDEAVKLMEEVYAEYGLFPSVDVMTFEKGA